MKVTLAQRWLRTEVCRDRNKKSREVLMVYLNKTGKGGLAASRVGGRRVRRESNVSKGAVGGITSQREFLEQSIDMPGFDGQF